MDTSTGHIHTDLSNVTNNSGKMVSVPAEFKDQAYELQRRGCSVFNPHHEFSEFREWALEKSKYYSRDKIDTLIKPIKTTKDTFTKTPRDMRKIQNRKRQKIAKASKKKNRKR